MGMSENNSKKNDCGQAKNSQGQKKRSYLDAVMKIATDDRFIFLPPKRIANAIFLIIATSIIVIGESVSASLIVLLSVAVVIYQLLAWLLNNLFNKGVELISEETQVILKTIKCEIDAVLNSAARVSLLIPVGRSSFSILSSIDRSGQPRKIQRSYFERSDDVEGIPLRTSEPLLVDAVYALEKSAYFTAISSEEKPKNSIFVPLLEKGKVVGMLAVDSERDIDENKPELDEVLNILKEHNCELAKSASASYMLESS